MLATAASSPTDAAPGAARTDAPASEPSKLDHALAFAARGLAVFPLQENAKTPLPGTRGHLDATTDPEAIRRAWSCALTGAVLPYNIGASPRDGRTVIVDLDVKDGRDGINAYLALGGELTGLVISTPSGGRHIYCAGEDIRTSAGKLAAGVDLRGADGYAVAPGSTIDGVSYRIVEDGPLQPLPAFVAEKVGTRAERDRTRLVTSYAIEPDGFANVRRAIRVAKAAEPACGGMWHDLGFRLGAEMARIGLSGDMAVRVLERHWQPRGIGFKSRDQFVRDVLGGHETAVHDGDHGRHAVPDVRALFDGFPVVLPPADTAGQTDLSAASGSRLRFVPQPDCRSGQPRRYVVKGLIARGDLAIVLGAPGAGKSAFTPLVCQAVASGGYAFGRRTRQGEVLYVAAEDAHGLRGRMQALGERHSDAPAFVLVEGVSDLFTPGGQAADLLRHVRERRPAVVVIDTLAAANPGLRESESDDMGRVVHFARQLATGENGAPGPAVVLVHHTPKAGDTPRGHSSLNGAADVVILLERDEASGIVSARLTKNRNGPSAGVEMTFAIESAVIGQDEDGDDISAALAVEVEAGTARRERGLSGQVRTALALLETLILDAGPDVQTAPADLIIAGTQFGGSASVLTAAWQTACEMHGVSAAGEPESRSKAFRRAKKTLLERRLIVELGERVYRLWGSDR